MLRLALPNIVSNISVPLLSTVDTALMGQLSAAHLGAVGLGSMMFNFIYWNFGFLRMGTTGLTAQAHGAGDDSASAKTLTTAVLLALTLSIGLWLLQVPLYALAAKLLSVSATDAALVAEYFDARIWAAPASLLLYVAAGWLFGMQNAKLPLLLAVSVNVVNIGVSYYLVRVVGLDTAGVAWGRVVAQYFGLLLAVVLIAWRYPAAVALARKASIGQLQDYRRLLRVNADIFLRTLCLTIAFGFLYSRAAADSALSLAVVTVLLQFLNWMSYGIDGFAYAAESVVGRLYGAGDATATRKAVRLSMGWGIGLGAGFGLTYFFFGDALVGIFTDDEPVRVAARESLRILPALCFIGAACYIWDGVFVGLTATKSMRDTMAIALVLYLGTYYLLRTSLGDLPALWWAMLVFLGGRGLIQTLWWWRRGLALR